ncbi:hypothetical protein KIM372_16610 [Bombiscardovia nodaiensis]|uniref:PIN domain-containing protein n=1 Tax=Bombiscardovia nodaiensis TaxID=2932181 RepID=A0ABM8BAB1_9BIFI|nr:hypothetical protein KIM372_16610 [Bombiscardovia nodaiensis]
MYAFYKADSSMFEIYASEDVIAETIRSIRRNFPAIPGENITRIARQLRGMVNLVESFDCEAARKTYTGDDPYDLHVHAATVDSGCDYLITNDKGFIQGVSKEVLEALPYTISCADDFFILLAESSTKACDEAVEIEMSYYAEKELSSDFFQNQLVGAGCPLFAQQVRITFMRLSGLSPSQIKAELGLEKA